ncbi:MAG: hypothetical protein H7X97_12135 [Opitutaceae bacterium]|nr:hypothetical protein [Verrucomicrobiales bacterium]
MNTLHIILFVAVFGQANPQVESLVTRQQSSLGLLWAVEADIDVYYSNPNGKASDPPVHVWHYHWARDTQRERLHYRQLVGETKNKEQLSDRGDMLDDGSVRRVLMNWDYSKAEMVLPDGPNNISAQLRQRSRQPPRTIFLNPLANVILQAVQPQQMDIVRTVPEFIDESPQVTLVKTDQAGQEEVIAAHPDDRNGGNYKGCVTHLVFDAVHGGLICRQKTRSPANSHATLPNTIDLEIVKWSEPRPGVFLPLETRRTAVVFEAGDAKGQLAAESRMVISNVKVNEEVPESAFSLPFPKNLVVEDSTDPAKPVFHLWGADDKIAATSVDRIGLPVPVSSAPPEGWRWKAWLAPIVFAMVIVGLVGVWIYRRSKST